MILAQVEADQDANLIRPHERSRLVLVNLILVPKALAIKSAVQDMLGIVEFERPCAATVPWMAIELAAHHPGARLPLVKVVTRCMDTSDTLALLHEIDHRITLRVVLKNQMRGVVK